MAGWETLEPLIQAMNAPRKGREWEDDLYPRFLEIPTYEIVNLTGFKRQYINRLKNGKQKPSAKASKKLREVIIEYERKNSNNLHR